MSDVVVDASVLVAVLTDPAERGRSASAAVAGRELFAPTVLPYEVMHAIRRLELAGDLSAADATRAVARSFEVRIRLFDPATVVSRIWDLRQNVTPYDAAYVALAEQRSIPLVTLDRRLARASGVRCAVVFPD